VNQNVDHDNPIEYRTITGRETRKMVIEWPPINEFAQMTNLEATIKMLFRMWENRSTVVKDVKKPIGRSKSW
jgi:hypothetical protein